MADPNEKRTLRNVRKAISKFITKLERLDPSPKYRIPVEVTRDLLALSEERLNRALGESGALTTTKDLLDQIFDFKTAAVRPRRAKPGPRSDPKQAERLGKAQQKFVERHGREWGHQKDLESFAGDLDSVRYPIPDPYSQNSWGKLLSETDATVHRKLAKTLRQRWSRLKAACGH